MHKNRIIIILGIFILFLTYYLNFTPSTKRFLVALSAAIIVVLALFIERKGFFSLQWRKRNTTTPVARTYIEHNGNAIAPAVSDISAINSVADSVKK